MHCDTCTPAPQKEDHLLLIDAINADSPFIPPQHSAAPAFNESLTVMNDLYYGVKPRSKRA